MPRWLPIVLITSVASIATSSLFAQEKSIQEQIAQDKTFSRAKGPGPQLGGRLSRFREENPRAIPPAEYLIYVRAHKQAEHRAAILESQRWAGYYPTRPTIPYDYYGMDANPCLYKPWVAAYFIPGGY
jgi:hypothetical protein